MTELNKAQMKTLRKLSHTERSILQIGKQGLTEAFIDQIDSALEKRELVKFNILQNSVEDVTDAAEEIAQELDAIVVQTIGSTAVLYRKSSQEKYQKITEQL